MALGSRFIQYIGQSRDELKKVVWPSRRETTRNTLIVIAISLAVAAFLGALDYLFAIGLGFIIPK